MWYKKPLFLCVLALSVVTVLSFSLMSVWGFFAYIALAGLMSLFGIAAYKSFYYYKDYKFDVKQKRYTDAYTYAEEKGSPGEVFNFKYPREEEYKIRMTTTNRFILFLSCIFCLLLAVYLFVYMIIYPI